MTDVAHLGPEGPMLQRPPDAGLRSQGPWSKQHPSWTIEQPWRATVRYIARTQPPCTGRIQVQVVTQHAIDWACSDCDERGTITGYAEDASNLSRYHPKGQLVTWYLGEAGGEYLREETRGQPHLRAVLARASPSNEPQNLLVSRATANELHELADLIDSARRSHTLHRNARPIADELLASVRSVLGAWDVAHGEA
jgi:hypothetical protein